MCVHACVYTFFCSLYISDKICETNRIMILEFNLVLTILSTLYDVLCCKVKSLNKYMCSCIFECLNVLNSGKEIFVIILMILADSADSLSSHSAYFSAPATQLSVVGVSLLPLVCESCELLSALKVRMVCYKVFTPSRLTKI